MGCGGALLGRDRGAEGWGWAGLMGPIRKVVRWVAGRWGRCGGGAVQRAEGGGLVRLGVKGGVGAGGHWGSGLRSVRRECTLTGYHWQLGRADSGKDRLG